MIMLMCNEYKELPKEYRADLVPVAEGSIPVQGSFYEYEGRKKEFSLLYDIKKDLKMCFHTAKKY